MTPLSPPSPSPKRAQRSGAHTGDAEHRRLLLRLQGDVQQVMAEIAALRAETGVLLEVQTQRPLTSEERARKRTLNLESLRLRLQLQQLAAEFAAVQQHGEG
jgi:hypothetical protein